MIYLDDPDFQLHVGDVRAVLPELAAGSVDCIVTSPPYWALRDYGTGDWEGGDPGCDHQPRDGNQGASGQRADRTFTGARPQMQSCTRCGAERVDLQLGLEETPELYLDALTAVFNDARRVLAGHGTLWLNLGDSYASASTYNTTNSVNTANGWKQDAGRRPNVQAHRIGMRPKNLVGIPWRAALALQADGWNLRSDIIWHKPNPMPSSVTDRPTVSHEYLFLLTKRGRYYYDQDAVREPHGGAASGNLQRRHGADVAVPGAHAGDMGRSIPWSPALEPNPDELTLDGLPPERPRGADGRRVTGRTTGPGAHENHQLEQGERRERWPGSGRNARSVWEIATQPYADAHFATFPEELARRAIAAGCPERVCLECGLPSERIVERESSWADRAANGATRGNVAREGNVGAGTQRGVHAPGASHDLDSLSRSTVGWTDCGHGAWRPGVVLDPFMGSGTTALVARRLGRHAVGVELNDEYAALCARRLQQLSLLA